MLLKKSFIQFSLLGLLILLGCTTYYQKSVLFQQNFVKGDFEEANKILDKNKKASKDKNRLLYFLQKGVVSQLLGNYEESNTYFEEAYTFTEDFRKSYTKEAASILSNPNLKPYTGEDHELVLLHYYKSLNYLRLKNYESALVECRRLNNKLNLLNDRYEKKKNRYKQDGFAQNLMGIIYEASGDVNNAFIAYKNAYTTYETNYKINFNTDIPLQLKKDVLRTAHLNGFYEELETFEKKFSMKYEYTKKSDGELVFFWHNGLGPVKSEWSINFFVVKGQGGMVMFVNEELGLSFPFPLPTMGQSAGGIGDLKFVRAAFPKYIERKPYFRSAELLIDEKKYKLELGENINEIAFKTLEDRMHRELANSLMRLAVKQLAEEQVRKQNENLGALLSALNAVSEKADTRNWQTLPYSISYARIPLNKGENSVKFKTFSPRKSREEITNLNFKIGKNETQFYIHNSLQSIPLEENW